MSDGPNPSTSGGHRLGGRRQRLVVLGCVLALLVGVPVGVYANHRFSDVPAGAYYHDAVSRIADAGITSGCGGGNYCPNDAVRRGDMAIFLNRTAARTAYGEGSTVLDTTNSWTSVVAQVTIDVSGASGSTSFVDLDASFTAFTSDEVECPCELEFWLERVSDGAFSGSAWEDLSGTNTGTGWQNASGSLDWTLQADGGTTETYALVAFVPVGSDPSEVFVEGSISATNISFGADGGSALNGGSSTASNDDPGTKPREDRSRGR